MTCDLLFCAFAGKKDFNYVVKNLPNRNMKEVYQYYLGTYKHTGNYKIMKETVKLHRLTDNLDTRNSNTCAICDDGGDLLCCDVCPLAFHLHCLDPPRLEAPTDDVWECEVCVEKKYDKMLFCLEETEGTWDRGGGKRNKTERVEGSEREIVNILVDFLGRT